MRLVQAAAAVAIILSPTPILAQTAPPSAAARHYTTDETTIGQILDDPAAKAIVDKHIPDLLENPQIDMAREMTLKAVQVYVADKITDKALAEIDAEFKTIPAKG